MKQPYIKPQIFLEDDMTEDILFSSSEMYDPAGDDIFDGEW